MTIDSEMPYVTTAGGAGGDMRLAWIVDTTGRSPTDRRETVASRSDTVRNKPIRLGSVLFFPRQLAERGRRESSLRS